MNHSRAAPPGPPGGPDVESTAVLLRRMREGDLAARDRLMSRYLPILRRWAHGRLPARGREVADTDDLVQMTLLRALDHLEGFEARREGAFLAWLRRILLNAIRDELRRVARRPGREPFSDELAVEASVVEEAVGREFMADYEAALARLPDERREAVILRIEFGFSYQEIADALAKPTANAAHMTVARALVRLAELMDENS